MWIVYRECHWDMKFPVVIPKKNCVAVNEAFEAEIGIGSYLSLFDPKTTTFMINGMELPIDSTTGLATYKHTSNRKGEINLAIEIEMLNQLTGEVIVSESVYTYEVH